MTTIQMTQPATTLADQHARFLEESSIEWLRPLRQQAMQRFTQMGFPTTRDEQWRFTNISPIAKTSFQIASEGASLRPQQVTQFDVPNLNPMRIVFVDGRLASDHSNIRTTNGLTILSLKEAATSHRAQVESHLTGHQLHSSKADAFTNLNTAFAEDGVFIHIAKNAHIAQPIEILSIATSARGDSPVMTHPRNIIIAEQGAEVTVVERYVSLDGGVYFTNAVTDIQVGENATVNHYLIEEEGGSAFNISTLRTRQLANSRCNSHTILLGGKLVRNNVHAILDGTGADCLINGLYIGSDQQHMDNHMRVEHAKEHGDSRQFYKGVLNDKSTAVFAGRIIVHPGAQKTDAKQTNKNLLLSQEAHVDTQPQLEIYADDVKCTHGATIGQMDEAAIFYLRARGISEDAARSMLIHSFAGESLSRMSNEAIRLYLDKILFARLPGGDLLEHML